MFFKVLTSLSVLFASCSQLNDKHLLPLQADPTVNLDTVKFYDTLTRNVVISNPNSEDIKIINLSASCGCVVSNLSDSVIVAGRSTNMTLNYTPSVSGDSGSIQKVIAFRTDKDLPLKSIVLKAFVDKK